VEHGAGTQKCHQKWRAWGWRMYIHEWEEHSPPERSFLTFVQQRKHVVFHIGDLAYVMSAIVLERILEVSPVTSGWF